MSTKVPRLVWLDLEMTGLDPETCAIVQLAMIITDINLEPITDPLEITIWQPESVLETMSPFVRAMHQKSGLLELIRRSEVSLEEAQTQALKILSKHSSYQSARLCGNSIGQDRRFLVKYMPAFENYLSYRQIDVSTLKELARWWHNIRYEKPKEGRHTALADVRESIIELKHYRKVLLKSERGA